MPRLAASVARAKSALLNRRKSATCCGRAARTLLEPSDASAPLITCRTASCRERKVAQTLRAIGEIGKKYDIAISNIFHAGDGNMHPILPFDPRKHGELERAQPAGEEILRYCISVGGSITGEHGVGMEKLELMAEQFSDDTLEMIRKFKALFDPVCRLNPGKVLPTGKGCLEIRQKPGMMV